MILGRNPALWAGAIAAILNVAVIVFGVPLTLDGLAALNVAAVAIIGLIANQADPTTQPTFAPTFAAPTLTSPPSSSATGSLSGGTGLPTADSPAGTTTDPTAGGPGAGAGS